MNNIDKNINGFDFCWSACAFEHLGSIARGLDFVANSIDCLRPGGIAIHTTEFNLSSNDRTLESTNLSFFRKQDIELLIQRLNRAGHAVAPVNFYPGETEVDTHVDLPPYSLPHLKLATLNYVITSIGIIIQKNNKI